MKIKKPRSQKSLSWKENLNLKIIKTDSQAFIEYCNYMDDIYKNIEERNLDKERKKLVVFDMIADMLSNKSINPIVADYLLEVQN